MTDPTTPEEWRTAVISAVAELGLTENTQRAFLACVFELQGAWAAKAAELTAAFKASRQLIEDAAKRSIATITRAQKADAKAARYEQALQRIIGESETVADAIETANDALADELSIVEGRPGRFHPNIACVGQFCCIHNPSEHHMRDWPLVLRESTLMERTCSHGVGHPDPDSLAYFKRLGVEGFGIHSCDGCCVQKEKVQP